MFLCPKKLLMGLLFMLLASSMAFQAVRSVLGGWIATQEGLPKIGGLFVHALVFMLLSTLIWRYAPFGSSNFEGDAEEYGHWGRYGRWHERFEGDAEEFSPLRPKLEGASTYEEPEEFRRRCYRTNRYGERHEVPC